MLRLVIDTNVLLVSISTRSSLRWIFDLLLEGKYQLCVTTDMLVEYAEIIGDHMGAPAAENALGLIENLPNVKLITTYYQFHLLGDQDDNKFVDCAIAAGADFIITHDKDFKSLEKIAFPKIEVINTIQLKALLQN